MQAPWHQEVLDISNMRDDQKINILVNEYEIYQPSEWLTGYIDQKGLGHELVYVNDTGKLLQQVMKLDIKSLYVVHLPKKLVQEDMSEFWNGIQELKDGCLYDRRCRYKEKTIDVPCIWVFTDVLPNLNYLHPCKWKLWKIENRKLVKLEDSPFNK